MTRGSKALILAICVAAAIAGFAVSQRWQTSPGGSPNAPAFSLLDLQGNPVSLQDHAGKLVLVNFWASWCAPCLKEIPLLVQAQQRFGARGLQILGPAMDDPERARDSARRLGMNYPVLIGENAIPGVMEALGDTLGALPFSVLVSAEGKILARKHGEFSEAELNRWISENLPAT